MHKPFSTLCVHAKLLQSCLTLCDPMDYSLPGSSVHGLLQARILEWVAMLFSRGFSQPKDPSPALTDRFFTTSTTWEAHSQLQHLLIGKTVLTERTPST